jgi:hypothetical protein
MCVVNKAHSHRSYNGLYIVSDSVYIRRAHCHNLTAVVCWRCHTLPRTAAHYQSHCRILLRALRALRAHHRAYCQTLPHIGLHTAARTAAHCCCRTAGQPHTAARTAIRCMPYDRVPYAVYKAICRMPYAISRMPQAVCRMPYAPYAVYAGRRMQSRTYIVCRMPHAVCNIPYTAFHMSYAIYHTRYAVNTVCRMPYALYATYAILRYGVLYAVYALCLMPLLLPCSPRAVCSMRYLVCGLHHCVLSSISEY